MPKAFAAVLAMAGTLAAGLAGGFAARSAHLPLPWLLGALFTTTALSLAGAPVRLIPWGRPAGTVVVGASTGLQFTATVVAKLVTLLPLIIATAFVSTLVGAVGGLLYMRLTGVDRTTAFFATVPGGVIETTTLAPLYGGQLEPIMVAQTTRVALIVVFAPQRRAEPAARGAGAPMVAGARAHRGVGDRSAAAIAHALPQCLADGAAVHRGRGQPPRLARRAPARYPDHRGSGGDRQRARCPVQARISHPPVPAAAGVVRGGAVRGGIDGVFGAAVAWLAGYSVPTMVLAVAPAGIAEMVLTGKVLGLDSTMIAGFQLMRILIVLVWCRTALVLFRRVAEWTFGPPPDDTRA
jgi:uncharacterized protein